MSFSSYQKRKRWEIRELKLRQRLRNLENRWAKKGGELEEKLSLLEDKYDDHFVKGLDAGYVKVSFTGF